MFSLIFIFLSGKPPPSHHPKSRCGDQLRFKGRTWGCASLETADSGGGSLASRGTAWGHHPPASCLKPARRALTGPCPGPFSALCSHRSPSGLPPLARPAAAPTQCRPKALSRPTPHHAERADGPLLILPSLPNWSCQHSTRKLPRGPSTRRQVLSGHGARCQGGTTIPKPTGRVQPRTPTRGSGQRSLSFGKRWGH